jgi:hypothetical protein
VASPDARRAILRALRDRPHDDTTGQVAAHAALTISVAAAVLDELRDEHLVVYADGHWQLSARGWSAARELPDPSPPS